MSEIFTVTEACLFANVTPKTMYYHLKQGNVSGTRIPNTNPCPTNSQPFTWLVDRSSLEAYYYPVEAGKKQHTFRRVKKTNPSKIRWVNIYPKGDLDPYLFKSKKEAKENADVDVVETRAIQIVI